MPLGRSMYVYAFNYLVKKKKEKEKSRIDNIILSRFFSLLFCGLAMISVKLNYQKQKKNVYTHTVDLFLSLFSHFLSLSLSFVFSCVVPFIHELFSSIVRASTCLKNKNNSCLPENTTLNDEFK